MRFRPTCKLIFSTNPLPRFTDTSLGVWRRMVIVPFEYVVPADRINVHLRQELTAELPGIFVWALEGAARLMAQRNFSVSAACERKNREYRLSCFPVLTFLEECTQRGGSVTSKLLWSTYRAWCREFGLSRVKPLHSFIKDVVGFLPNIQYPRVPAGLASEITLAGIQLREGLQFSMDTRAVTTPSFYDP